MARQSVERDAELAGRLTSEPGEAAAEAQLGSSPAAATSRPPGAVITSTYQDDARDAVAVIVGIVAWSSWSDGSSCAATSPKTRRRTPNPIAPVPRATTVSSTIARRDRARRPKASRAPVSRFLGRPQWPIGVPSRLN